MKKWVNLAFFLYLFVLAIELIKKTSLILAPDISKFLLDGMNPSKAIATGWFTTTIFQSSGAVGSVIAAFAGNNILELGTAVYILMGALIGTAITALLISIITISQKRRDFRHGFEIGLSYSIYSIILILIVLFLEFTLGLYSKSAFFIASLIGENISLGKIPDIIGTITNPIINILLENLNRFVLMALGFSILIFALRFMGKTVIKVFGGEEQIRGFINKHFSSKIKIYFLGVFLTAIVFSSSITISLLVPLAVSRIINLRKALPFIIGANLGTTADVFLASILIGNVSALAVFLASFLFSITGALIFLPNTKLLWKLTKHISKKTIHVSRRKALYFLLAFMALPLLMIWIF